MLLLLAVIFWLTITGANYPSQWLSGRTFLVGRPVGGFSAVVRCSQLAVWGSDSGSLSGAGVGGLGDAAADNWIQEKPNSIFSLGNRMKPLDVCHIIPYK